MLPWLVACMVLSGCTGFPTATQAQPSPSPAADEGEDASDSVLTGTVMPRINF
jgi:hypothetical protein